MELYLQFGHGMMDHCKRLIRRWGGGTAILSPRDLTRVQIAQLATDILDANGATLLDPQLYEPRSTHHRLVSHDYWPNEYDTSMLLGGPALNRLLTEIRTLNDVASTDGYIVPGLYCDRVDEDWLAVQEAILNEAVSVFTDKRRLATICLSGEAMRFEEQIEMVLSYAETWDVDGYYVVAEHPTSDYLVDDPRWLANLLILGAGLKLHGREVIVGYSSHQMICLAAANIDAIASGTWLNVRTFTTGRFQQAEEESVSRRAKWYYCPQTLSEYKIAFLDMAFERPEVMALLQPDPSLRSEYAEILFSGAQPTSTSYSEQQSLRHYLHCLHEQCTVAGRDTYKETVDAQMIMLETAERLIGFFHRHGIRGQDRDFADMIDVSRAALDGLDSSRGFVLTRQW